MATVLKEKEKKMKLAQVAKIIEEVTGKVTKVVKHLAQTTKISPKIVEAIDHLTTEKRRWLAY